jgi:hypothetical protein
MQKESLGQETDTSWSVAATVTGEDQAEPSKIAACVASIATQKVGLVQDMATWFRPALACADHDPFWYSKVLPLASTARQKLSLTHETLML